MIERNAAHILVVDDDSRIRELLSQYLQKNGFFVSTAKVPSKAELIMSKLICDLIILDLMMPEENGIDFALRIRKNSYTPILMLSAKGDTQDKILGLESGADDYLTKPFEPKELLLRVKKLLERSSAHLATKSFNKYNFGNFQYNVQKNILTNLGTQIMLTTSENKLLAHLLDNAGKVVERSKLAELCGGINERSIDVQIIRLRNKIENDPKKPEYLVSVRGEGYIFYN